MVVVVVALAVHCQWACVCVCVKRETAVRYMPNSQPLSEFEQERTSGRIIHTLEDVSSLRYEFAREQH